MKPLFSRYCMFTVVIMLLLGGFTTRAWGDVVPVYNGGTWYSLYDDTTVYTNEGKTGLSNNRNNTKFHTVSLVPPTTGASNNLTLQWKKGSKWPGCDIWVNGSTIASSGATKNEHLSLENANATIEVDATFFELGIHVSSNTGTVQNLKIPMAKHIRVNDGTTEGASVGKTSVSKTLDAIVYGNTSAAYHINLRSFLMQNNGLRYVSSNPEFHFGNDRTGRADTTIAVKANACAYGSGASGYDCTNASKVGILGNPDSYEVDVYFTPSTNDLETHSTTITIYDGATARATITLTAKVIPTYYFKATAVATDGSSTLDIPVRASYTSGDYSASTASTSVTAATADVASLTKTAYYYAPASSGDYQFQGWYKTAACNGTRISTENTISCTITSNSLNSASPVDSVFYAKYLQEIRAEFTGSDQTLNVDGSYDGIGYTRTSAATASDDPEDSFWYEIIVDEISDVTTGSVDDDAVIAYNPSTKVVTAINAGTARLILHQEATGYYVDVDKTYTFTVNKYVTTLDGYVAPMLVDATPQIGSYKAENTSATYPSEGTSNDFYYTITNTTLHTPTVVTGCDDGHEEDVIGFTPSEHRIRAYNAGTAKLTIAQKETYKYTGDTLEMNISVGKHTPVYTWDGDVETKYTFEYPFNSTHREIFSTSSGEEVEYTAVSDSVYTALMVGDTLYVYNVDEIAHITISQPETYKWNAHEKTYTIKPVKEASNHVPFTYTQAMFNSGSITSHSAATSVGWDDGAAWVTRNSDEAGATHAWDDKYIDIAIEGIPDKLKFKIASTNAATGEYWYVKESADGSDWSGDEIWNDDKEGDSFSDEQVVSLQPSTRYVRLCYSGNLYGYFKDIKVTERFLFETDPKDLLDFGLQGQNYGKQEKTFNFNHINAGRVINVTITGTDKDYFSVVPTTVNGTGRDISGSTTLRVSFDNKETAREEDEPYLAKIEITDNQGHRDTVNLSGYRHGKSFPQFTFNPNHVPYYFGNTIYNVVSSTNTETGLDITSSDNTIAEIADGKLFIKNKGSEVTITVHQAEIGDFREHTETFKFTPRAMPPLSVPFMMADSICNNASMVTKGSDCGWTDDDCLRIGGSDWEAYAAGRYWDSRKEVVVEFGGAPDLLTFQVKNTYSAIVCRWKVEASYDGENWTEVFYRYQSCKDWTSFSVQLDNEVHFLRFSYGGNYAGYFKNINVTALDGIKYMLAPNGLYLSRGKAYGTQAVLDEFGVPVRVTRYTSDNVKANELMQVQFMDNRQYLYEASSGDVYTDNETSAESSRKLWNQIVSEGKVKVKSANGSNKYITITADSVLTTTSDAATATAWTIEDYTLHADRIQTKLDHKAAAAADHDFGAEINTMAKVRNMLETEDFDYTEIDIEDVSPSEQKGLYRYEYPDSRGTFSVYDQVITSLEPGFYRLTVQALYKSAPSPIDWQNHSNGFESVVGYAYANDFQYPIKTVYDATGRRAVTYGAGKKDTLCGGYYYPADLAAATDAFIDPETYKHDLYVYIPADEGKTTGTLRYGIKNPSYVPGVWMAYSNFKLEKIARKVFIFNGNEGSSTVWDENTNWEYQGVTPISTPGEKNAVVIQSDVVVAGEFKVYSMTIENGATVTIAPEGGLSIGVGGVHGATRNNLKLKASKTGGNVGQTGYLRIDPECPEDIEMPNATVELFSTAYWNKAGGEDAQWQMVGAPISDAGVAAKSVYAKSYVYSWDESANDWVNNRFSMTFEPFVGFETTQNKVASGVTAEYSGQLVSGREVIRKNLAYTDAEHGYNALANSFAAPMAIANFRSTDFVNAENTIYILNAGSKAQSLDPEDGYDAAGRFFDIPVGSAVSMAASFGTPLTIPSMQGFFVKATGSSASLDIDYSRLVWDVEYTGSVVNNPLRAPKRNVAKEEDEAGSLQMTLFANGEVDHLYVLESEDRLPEFENGYDAHKMLNPGMNIFAVEAEDELISVDATNSIIGTRVGVRTGEETAYTLIFSHLKSYDDLMLYDAETGDEVDINEGAMYTFFAEPNSVITERFEIVEREAPSITTGVDNADTKVKVHKFIKDNQVFILKNGVLYNTMGAIVR